MILDEIGIVIRTALMKILVFIVSLVLDIAIILARILKYDVIDRRYESVLDNIKKGYHTYIYYIGYRDSRKGDINLLKRIANDLDCPLINLYEKNELIINGKIDQLSLMALIAYCKYLVVYNKISLDYIRYGMEDIIPILDNLGVTLVYTPFIFYQGVRFKDVLGYNVKEAQWFLGNLRDNYLLYGEHEGEIEWVDI